jgi:hypothetical protein
MARVMAPAESRNCKFSIEVDNSPGRLGPRIDSIGTKRGAGRPTALNEFRRPSEVQVRGVDPMPPGIPGGQAELPPAEVLRPGIPGIVAHLQDIGVGLFASQVGHAPQG